MNFQKQAEGLYRKQSGDRAGGLREVEPEVESMESDLFRQFPLLWPESGVRNSQDSDGAPGLNPLCRTSFFRESSSFAVCGRVRIEEIEGLRRDRGRFDQLG